MRNISILVTQIFSFTIALFLTARVIYQTPDTLPGPDTVMTTLIVLLAVYTISSWSMRTILGVIGSALSGSLLLLMFSAPALRAKPPCDGYFNRVPCSSLNIPLMRAEMIAAALLVLIGIVVIFLRQQPPRKRAH